MYVNVNMVVYVFAHCGALPRTSIQASGCLRKPICGFVEAHMYARLCISAPKSISCVWCVVCGASVCCVMCVDEQECTEEAQAWGSGAPLQLRLCHMTLSHLSLRVPK